MEEKERKVVKRYSLILDIIPFKGKAISYNYYEFMKHFDENLDTRIEEKSPLAAIDRFTTKFESEEEFNRIHREFLSSDYRSSQFVLLTNIDPNMCNFNVHINYKAHYGSNVNKEPVYKSLDPVFGDNKYLVRFLENNEFNIRAEYDFNPIMWFMFDFYNRIIGNEEFYFYAVERLSGFHKYNRYANSESRLINEIEECRVGALENGEKFSVNRLTKLKRYKSLRAAMMVMSDYDKTKTSKYYYDYRRK